jgi:hypothetical protein
MFSVFAFEPGGLIGTGSKFAEGLLNTTASLRQAAAYYSKLNH